MAWNVENLFDTIHDEGFRDEEFLPQSSHHWTSHRYWKKLTDVAQTIAAVADNDNLPALVGLCEVENDSVLTMLAQRSILRTFGYQYVMSHSRDERGIDVALLYQPAFFRLHSCRTIHVPCEAQGMRPTRDLLHVTGLILSGDGVDTLHFFVVHLPSRASGHEGDLKRRLAAATLWAAVDSLSGKKVIAMGDFNANHRDRIFRHAPLHLTDDKRQSGTYCFRGYWEWLDHILLSPALSAETPARPIRLPWLLEENKTYGGSMPRRTFRGPAYHGGISDHLPVVLDVNVE